MIKIRLSNVTVMFLLLNRNKDRKIDLYEKISEQFYVKKQTNPLLIAFLLGIRKKENRTRASFIAEVYTAAEEVWSKHHVSNRKTKAFNCPKNYLTEKKKPSLKALWFRFEGQIDLSFKIYSFTCFTIGRNCKYFYNRKKL